MDESADPNTSMGPQSFDNYIFFIPCLKNMGHNVLRWKEATHPQFGGHCERLYKGLCCGPDRDDCSRT